MRYLIRLVLYYSVTVSREFVVSFLSNSLKDILVFLPKICLKTELLCNL